MDLRHQRAIGVACLLMLFACAHGTTSHFPRGGDPQTHASITLIRNRNIFGSALSPKVVLDGWHIAWLRPGEYVEFFVSPGMHTVGVAESTVAIPFQAGAAYYFLISVDDNAALRWSGGFEVERLNESEGKALAAGAKRVQ